MAAMTISGLSASAMAAKTTRVARARVSAKAPVFSVKASSSRARASATMASARAPVALGRSSARCDSSRVLDAFVRLLARARGSARSRARAIRRVPRARATLEIALTCGLFFTLQRVGRNW